MPSHVDDRQPFGRSGGQEPRACGPRRHGTTTRAVVSTNPDPARRRAATSSAAAPSASGGRWVIGVRMQPLASQAVSSPDGSATRRASGRRTRARWRSPSAPLRSAVGAGCRPRRSRSPGRGPARPWRAARRPHGGHPPGHPPAAPARPAARRQRQGRLELAAALDDQRVGLAMGLARQGLHHVTSSVASITSASGLRPTAHAGRRRPSAAAPHCHGA